VIGGSGGGLGFGGLNFANADLSFNRGEWKPVAINQLA
jgi:hypothetical protein